MNPLTTLPQSVQDQLSRADTAASTGNLRETELFIKQAAAELARHRPEVCALVIAAQDGCRELHTLEIERTTKYETVTTSVLGIAVSSKVKPVTTTTITERKWTLR